MLTTEIQRILIVAEIYAIMVKMLFSEFVKYMKALIIIVVVDLLH